MDDESLREFIIEILRQEPNASMDDIRTLWLDADHERPAAANLVADYEAARRQVQTERAAGAGRFSRKYSFWKERLLDLTAGNRLLNFRPTKVATIGVTAPRVEALYDRLVNREESLSFPLYQGRVQLLLADVTAEGDDAGAGSVPARYQVVPGDLEVAGKTPPELEKSLYRLSALARSSKEERGINTLYLALGMLVWRPVDGAGEQRAPLLLVPVELGRQDRFHPYLLSAFDEDSEVNPTLIYLLKRDFDFALPIFDPDPEAATDPLIPFFLQVQEAVDGQGWHVEDTAWLGQFNFRKLAMYRDLELHEPQAPENDRVAAIAGLRSFHPEADVGPAEAFDQISPAEVFSVKDADRSQVEALLRARNGQNLIIQGPPGTGKSQTITNLTVFGIQRTGPHVEAKIKRQIRTAESLNGIARRREFLWPAAKNDVAFRSPGPGDDARKIEHLPPEEIDAAVIHAVKESKGIARADVIVEVRKLLGYERAGNRIAPAITASVDRLNAKGRIVEQGGFLRLADRSGR